MDIRTGGVKWNPGNLHVHTTLEIKRTSDERGFTMPSNSAKHSVLWSWHFDGVPLCSL